MTLQERPHESDFDPDEAVAWAEFQASLGNYAATANGSSPEGPEPSPDLDDILASEEAGYDWAVPGLLERMDRLIVTAHEGTGKSTLNRQLAVQLGSGIHPFTLEPIAPLSVLFVDAENSRRQSRRQLEPLRAAAGAAYHRGATRFEFRPDGLDLALRAEDRQWLAERTAVNRPDVLIIGPHYKIAAGDPKDEQIARSVALFLDGLRDTFSLTVIVEAHVPYADSGKSARPMRPYGASLWARWPEFGIFLAKDGTLTHWRGQREERAWPAKLDRGSPWPWVKAEGADSPEAWDGPRACMEAVAQLLEAIAPAELSTQRLEAEIRARGHAFRNATIREAADRLCLQGLAWKHPGPRGALLYSTTRPSDPLPEDDALSWADEDF